MGIAVLEREEEQGENDEKNMDTSILIHRRTQAVQCRNSSVLYGRNNSICQYVAKLHYPTVEIVSITS